MKVCLSFNYLHFGTLDLIYITYSEIDLSWYNIYLYFFHLELFENIHCVKLIFMILWNQGFRSKVKSVKTQPIETSSDGSDGSDDRTLVFTRKCYKYEVIFFSS